MPRLSFKPDASFFRKIAIGAVGARAVVVDLGQRDHQMVELERGSTDTKLWKDVKRKRVRIPDLVCVRCGLRVESRAKTKAELSMSHSPTDEARAWDFGMVDSDVLAFPVCEADRERHWSRGRLISAESYWHERNWVEWRAAGAINYFQVSSFRSTAHVRSSTKGVTEGSETSIAWKATFSTRRGSVDGVGPDRVTVRRTPDGHRYTWRIDDPQTIGVAEGDLVQENQVIASAVRALQEPELRCRDALVGEDLRPLLGSRERTQRFTGVKLARLRRETQYREAVTELTHDPEEDVYIRLEGASYLTAVSGESARLLFEPYLGNSDVQTQLEAVIALGEAGTEQATMLLCQILDDTTRPYFLRSASAWSLARCRTQVATDRLVRAFGDVDASIREEALEGLTSLGGPALPALVAGIQDADARLAAGCAEALRQMQPLPPKILRQLTNQLDSGTQTIWTVWLLGHLPQDQVASSIARLQESAPHLQYAMAVLWAFVESWISNNWELSGGSGHAGTEVFA